MMVMVVMFMLIIILMIATERRLTAVLGLAIAMLAGTDMRQRRSGFQG